MPRGHFGGGATPPLRLGFGCVQPQRGEGRRHPAQRGGLCGRCASVWAGRPDLKRLREHCRRARARRGATRRGRRREGAVAPGPAGGDCWCEWMMGWRVGGLGVSWTAGGMNSAVNGSVHGADGCTPVVGIAAVRS
eukprot:scaffold1861_cov111-Isochrysis_galbana.AAC.11